MNLNYFNLFLELLSSKVFSEEFFWWDSQGFFFDKSFFLCVLEGFRLFKMCLYIKDRSFLESCAFVYNRV